jgi:hypothetical protein
MNAEEKIAEKYLLTLGKGNPTFEPDGNIPPDFSFCSGIGIEVRRLNENFVSESKSEGLEQLSIPLKSIIREITSEFDEENNKRTFWVAVQYSRPYNESFRDIKKEIRNRLSDFLNNPPQLPTNLSINSSLTLRIHKAPLKQGRVFIFALDHDNDRGGWVIDLFQKNVNLTIEEKELKINPYRSRYTKWWLLLVDSIRLPAGKEDLNDYNKVFPDKKSFEKVIVLNPSTGKPIIQF